VQVPALTKEGWPVEEVVLFSKAVTTKTSKWPWAWIAISLALLIAFSVGVPLFTGVSEVGIQTRMLINAKQVALSCRTYADENQGRFPNDLRELVPDYLPSDNADQLLLFLNSARIPKKPWYYLGTRGDWQHKALRRLKGEPWHYATGLTDKSPPDWFLIWSPEPSNGRRICMRCDASGQVMREENFRAEMKRQGRERELEEIPAAGK
jgi:hypothetical protein